MKASTPILFVFSYWRSFSSPVPRHHRPGAAGRRGRARHTRKVLRLPDGRRPQARQLGQAASSTTSCSPRARTSMQAGRTGQDERGPSVHRALHLVAGQPREARSATGRSTRGSPIRAGCPRPRRRKLVAEGKAVVIQSLRAALERGRRRRRRPPSSSTTASRAPTRRRSACSTTSSASSCRRSIPTARR